MKKIQNPSWKGRLTRFTKWSFSNVSNISDWGALNSWNQIKHVLNLISVKGAETNFFFFFFKQASSFFHTLNTCCSIYNLVCSLTMIWYFREFACSGRTWKQKRKNSVLTYFHWYTIFCCVPHIFTSQSHHARW